MPEQTIDTPDTSLAEKIVEVPVVRTPKKTPQVANTLVQHVVNAIEAERPKIIKQTGQKPIIQEKINQVTKHVQDPHVQFPTRLMKCPSVCRDRSPWSRLFRRPWRFHSCVLCRLLEKTVEGPQFQIVEKTAEVSQTQVIQGAQTSESLGIAPEHQPAQAETLEVEKIGALSPAESAVLVPVAVPKTFDSPRVQVVSIPVMAQKQVPSAPRFQKIVKMPKVQFSDGEVNMPVVAQRQVLMIPNVQKTVEVPQIQYVDKIVDAPVVAWTEDAPSDADRLQEEKASFGD